MSARRMPSVSLWADGGRLMRITNERLIYFRIGGKSSDTAIQVRRLRELLTRKKVVEYESRQATGKEAIAAMQKAERFVAWADKTKDYRRSATVAVHALVMRWAFEVLAERPVLGVRNWFMLRHPQ